MLLMARVWVVCGAGRAAGKTRLARALCRVLPRAAYAKLGHGRRRPGGPEPFFRSERALEAFVAARAADRDFIVVESGAWARAGKGDLILFLDGPAGRLDARPDVSLLRRRAHVRLGPGSSPRSWERVLRRHLPEARLRKAVGALLEAQSRFLEAPALQVRSKVWLVSGRGRVFGSGIARLLGEIERLGSLREAARAAGVSYRHAWGILRTAARRLGRPLIHARPGGAGGGGTALSPEGRRLARIFDRLNGEVEAFANRRFAEFLREAARS